MPPVEWLLGVVVLLDATSSSWVGGRSGGVCRSSSEPLTGISGFGLEPVRLDVRPMVSADPEARAQAWSGGAVKQVEQELKTTHA